MLEVRKAKGKDTAARGAWGRPDPWQTAVYAFEDDWPSFGKGTLTLAECRTIVRSACAAYNLKPPRVKQHEGRALSFLESNDQRTDNWLISFRLDHKNPAIVLHESAHYIIDRLYGARGRQQDHGPLWQGVYFFLLARSDMAPVEALKASARSRGIRWRELAPADICKNVIA